jgi:hypothetical protein
LTTASCPFSAVRDSGVRPSLESFESTSALPVSSSSLTAASCPSCPPVSYRFQRSTRLPVAQNGPHSECRVVTLDQRSRKRPSWKTLVALADRPELPIEFEIRLGKGGHSAHGLFLKRPFCIFFQFYHPNAIAIEIFLLAATEYLQSRSFSGTRTLWCPVLSKHTV